MGKDTSKTDINHHSESGENRACYSLNIYSKFSELSREKVDLM